MKCALIGEKLGHSFSKEIHEGLNRYEYELIELAASELGPFLKRKDFSGLNVTIPYKEAVIPYLDEISGEASEAGAVNTIVNKAGRLIGYNTDIGGMTKLIEKSGVGVKGKTVLIAGTGGTSKTASYVADRMGAAEIKRMSRSEREDAISYEKAYVDFSHAEIIINTTPCGMYPNSDASPIAIGKFPKAELVIDAIYNPLKTRLVRDAARLGIKASGGLYMLVAQALLSAELFSDEDIPDELFNMMYEEIKRDKSNIVLIGMPGSGKTYYGEMLSKQLRRELVDTDDVIVAEEGMPVREIFEKKGEEYFRNLESSVIKRVSESGGKIISTGGGAVLREENADALSSNGRIIFLNRNPKELVPTSDRPLADNADKMKELYEKRLPIYKAAADAIIDVEGWDERIADKIWGAML